jgi:hypothetical protein
MRAGRSTITSKQRFPLCHSFGFNLGGFNLCLGLAIGMEGLANLLDWLSSRGKS